MELNDRAPTQAPPTPIRLDWIAGDVRRILGHALVDGQLLAVQGMAENAAHVAGDPV